MFGIVSTGPSSLAIDMTYDRKRLDEAIEKISGAGLSPKDILDAPDGSQGPTEVRYRAHVAFSTVYDILNNLEQVHNRRKAFIYVSDGYDFNPFEAGRQRAAAERAGMSCDRSVPGRRTAAIHRATAVMAAAAAAVIELVRSEPVRKTGKRVRRCRSGLGAGLADPRSEPRERDDLHDRPARPRGRTRHRQEVDMLDWQNYVTESQNSLRVLAEQTGGFAAVNQNDFTKALKRIDAETSDYYVLGYYSTNPDPTKKRRRIDVNVTRPNVNVLHRTEYTLKAPPVPRPAPAKITKPTDKDKDKKGGGG